MARRALASCSVALAVGVAHADTPVDQPTAFDVDRLTPPAGRSELGFDGGAPLATWGVSVGLGYLDRPYVVATGVAVDHRETLALGGAVAFGTSIVVEARLPLSHQVGDRFAFLGDGGRLDRWVPGDLHIAARARVGTVGDVVSVFARGDLGLPTGDEYDFAGDLRYSVATSLIGRVDLGPVIVAGAGGVKLRGGEVLVAGHVLGDELDGSLGAIVPIGPVKLTAELDAALGDNVAGKRGPSPVEASGGIVVEPIAGLQVGLRAGAGLDDQIGAPRFRAMLEVAWQAPAAPPAPATPVATPPSLDEE